MPGLADFGSCSTASSVSCTVGSGTGSGSSSGAGDGDEEGGTIRGVLCIFELRRLVVFGLDLGIFALDLDNTALALGVFFAVGGGSSSGMISRLRLVRGFGGRIG